MKYLEDLSVGDKRRFGAYQVTREEVLEFAGKYDPQPFHLSDEAAAKTHFGRLAASGWHTCAMTMAMLVEEGRRDPGAGLGSPGVDELRWLKPVYPGDTLNSVSEVIGLKENSNRKTGIVYVRSRGYDQTGDVVLDYARWVMVKKRDENAPTPEELVPTLPASVPAAALGKACPTIDTAAYDTILAGSPHRFGDYKAGEKIDHLVGITVENAEHMIATRLYQNTARIHFDHFTESKGRFGHRLIYGGHAISLARALSFNGLANAFHVAAINGGRHVSPLFAGLTVFAWSEVLEAAEVPGRNDVGALRLRTIATKDKPCDDFPCKIGKEYDPAVILDLDYWVLMPR